MHHNTLGRTGLDVTRLGYGSMGLRGPRTWGVRVVSDADADAFLNAVLDAGINFIDTAPDYGLAEERIGRAIGHRRDEFFLATKCGCAPVQHDDHLEIRHVWNRETIERNIADSLALDVPTSSRITAGERAGLPGARANIMFMERHSSKRRHAAVRPLRLPRSKRGNQNWSTDFSNAHPRLPTQGNSQCRIRRAPGLSAVTTIYAWNSTTFLRHDGVLRWLD
jgi:hypothetical protein